MDTRTLLNRSVIGVFLALVVGVVFLQIRGKTPLPAAVVDVPPAAEEVQSAPEVVADVCGDRRCTGTENCESCGQDCGLCTQTYCCHTENRTCDGPFGVPENRNPCDSPGYSTFLYTFPQTSTEMREQAYNSCQQTCVSPQ